MSTTLNDSFWLERITQCRSSGLTDRQWCIENGIPVSTFYYHVRALRKKPVKYRKRRTLPDRSRKLSRYRSGKKGSGYRMVSLLLPLPSVFKCRASVLRSTNMREQT